MDIQIDKNIPIPPKGKKTTRWAWLLEKMVPGDSVLLPNGDALRFQQTVFRNFKGFKAITRQESDEKSRVWIVRK